LTGYIIYNGEPSTNPPLQATSSIVVDAGTNGQNVTVNTIESAGTPDVSTFSFVASGSVLTSQAPSCGSSEIWDGSLSYTYNAISRAITLYQDDGDLTFVYVFTAPPP
jgi:hypothetical protein